MQAMPVGSRISTMRRLVPLFLGTACLAALSSSDGQSPALKQIEAEEQKLKEAKLETDTPSLFAYLRARTLNDDERAKVELLIAQLGAKAFRTREQATQALVERGPVVVELLKRHLDDPDPEISHRAEKCIQKIKDNDQPPEVSATVVRLLAARKPAGAVESLLAYLPFADSDTVADEVRTALTTLAVQGGKVDKALVAALQDKEGVRRGAAGEALTKAGVAEARDGVVALLKDPNPTVRWRVATALVLAKNKEAMPVLIDSLVEATQGQAWQIEDMLYRLADGKSPPAVSLGVDPASRKKYRDAWRGWWDQHAKDVDLAVLHQAPKLLGYTTIVLLDQNQIIEVDPNNVVRWKIDHVNFPLDVQVLPGDKVLIAEYKGRCVTERNFKGEILWKRDFGDPQMAQRLPNGNTFIAGKYHLLEVDPTGNKVVFSYNVQGVDGIMKCVKLTTGEIVCLFEDARVVRLDSNGKELSSFQIEDLGMRLFGGRIDALPGGRVLIPHHGENKVVEYDPTGKVVWQVKVNQPIAATRLPNGNTIVTSMEDKRAVEFDRNGAIVWQYTHTTRVTRAIRR
jgi:HEAT repeat protein